MKLKILNLSLFTAAIAVLTTPAAKAANDTWVGNTDNKWSTPGNWSPASAPVAADWLFFGVAGSAGASLTNDLTAGLSFGSITFNSGASAYTLVGNPIVLAGGITNNSTSAQTISFPITNTAVRTLFTSPSGGNLTLNGGLYGTGGGLTVIGGGVATIGGANNTFTAATTVTNATIILGASKALPLAALNLLGSSALGGSPGKLDLNGFDQTITGGNDALVGADANNTTQTGAFITNSSATLATFTITNYGNTFKFREGNWGGNLKLVLRANNLGNNQSGRPGSAFQAQVPGNTYSGGTVISGPWSNPFTVTNLHPSTGFATSGNTNTAIMRYFNAGTGFSVFGSGPITFDNGELWGTSVYTHTNPVIITSRGGIWNCEANQFFGSSATFTGSGLLALASNGGKVYSFTNDLSGFTGTLALDANTTSVNLCSNAPAGELLFWGAFSNGRGIVQWNGDASLPVMLSLARVNCGSAGGVVGGVTTVGILSCGNATALTYRLGDNSATTNLFGGYVTNGSGTVSVAKIGSNTQTLSGANAYTGATLVGGGTLKLTGVNSGAGGFVISNNAVLSFGGSGSMTDTAAINTVKAGGILLSGGANIGGLLVLESGNAAINLQDNVINTNTLGNGLTLDNGNALSFELGGASDVIAITGGTYTKNAGTVTVNIAGTGFGAGTYPLISGAGITDTNGFVLGSIPANPSFAYTLVADSGNLALQVSLAVVTPAVAHWKGGVNNNWSTADSGPNFNWADSSAGTTSTGAKPGVTTAVTFSATGAANQTTVLGGDFEISSLNLTSAANIAIGGGNILQIDSGGLTIASGAGNLTISNSSLVLGGTQLWTNDSANILAVSAPISGLSTVTLGGGNTVWSGANTHGGTTLTAGKLALTGAGMLGSSSSSLTAAAGAIDLGGSSQSVGPVTLAGGAAITNGTITGTGYDLQSGLVSAVVAGSLSVNATKTTPDTVILSADNTLSGNVNVNEGTLQIGAGGSTGKLNPAALVISNGAAVVFNSTATQTNSTLISGAGPLSVVGGASLRLLNVNSTFSGDVTLDGGTLISGTTANNGNATFGVFGNPSLQRTFFLTNGATLGLFGGNTFGGWASTRCAVDLVIGPGCQLVINANDSNPVGDISLSGGTISVGNGFSTLNQALNLFSNVVVEGTSPSAIISTGGDVTRNGVMLGKSQTDATTDFGQSGIHFVVNSTGSSSADLTVSARLVDPSFSGSFGAGSLYPTANGGVYKQGAGTMLLTAMNTYTGPTIIEAGKLVVSSVQGPTGMTNYVAMADSAALGVLVSGTNQWSPSQIQTYGGATFEFTSLVNTNIAPLNPGSLSLGGGVTVNVNGVLYVGTYPLIANAAASIGSFTLGSLPYGVVATLGTSGSDIVLNVTTGSAPLIWSGNNNSDWDTTTANNWLTNATGLVYFDGSLVLFDDSSSRTNVTLAANVAPASITVSNNTRNYTFASSVGAGITGSSDLKKQGNGTLTIANTNSYVGNTVISAGTLQLGDGTAKNGVVAGNITDNAKLTFANPQDQTVSGVISGAGSVFKTAAGILTITASNTYSGGTTLAAGTVLVPVGSKSAFGSGTLTLSNANLVVQPNNAAGGIDIANSVLVPAGTATLVENSQSIFGNLWVGSDAAQWTGSGTVNFRNNGAVNITAVLWNANPLTNFTGIINLGSINAANQMLNGIGYNGSAGQYTLPTVFDASGAAWELGDVGYTLTSVVNSCDVVKLGSIAAVNPNTVLRGNQTLATTIEVGARNTSTTFAGMITNWGGAVSLVKVGAGTLTLSGTNAYTGNTTIKGGTLELAQTYATLATNSSVIITNGAQLKLTVTGVTNRVGVFVLNGVAQANGYYTSANSSGSIIGAGVLQVGTISGPTGPGSITNSISGSTLTLTWPAGQGWRLESQTNSLTTGLTTSGWNTVSGVADGSATITVDASKPTVFYRLVYP